MLIRIAKFQRLAGCDCRAEVAYAKGQGRMPNKAELIAAAQAIE